jgi:peptidoglycan/xylan/chitin deacetylase (PgdA/CDA1 family)
VIADHVIRSVYPGAIVLMHDGGGDRAQTVQALETVLRKLSAQGYAFHNIFVQ